MLRYWLYLIAVLLAAVPARGQGSFWEPADGPYGGTVVQVLAATAGGDLLAGTPGGVFRSRDGGTTWADDGLAGDVRALVVHPDGTVYAGLYGEGVYRRLPGAGAWEASGIRGVLTRALLVDRTGSLFVGTLGGLIRSDDEGVTMRVLPFFNEVDGGVQVLAANDTYVFAGTRQGVYRSSDGGVSWEVASLGIQSPNVTALAVNAAGDVYAGTATGAVYRSRNQGSLWTALPLRVSLVAVRALATGPDGALYVGGYRFVLRSTSDGDTWEQAVASPVHVQAFAFTGAHVLAGTEGRGVVRAAPGGVVWEDASEGLLSTVHDVRAGGDGAVYVATAGGVYRSADRGATWTALDDGLATLDTRLLDFDARGRLLAGTVRGLYRFDPGTQAWTSVSPPGSPAIRDLAVGPDSTLYAGYYAGLYRLNRLGVWEQYPLRGPDNAMRDVIALAVDGAGTLYAGSYWDAFRADGDPSAFAPMALLPVGHEGVQTFLLHPDGTILAGTRYSGVLYSTDRGLTWAQRVRGLTGLEDIRALALDERDRLYAATYGSGVFRYDADADLWRAVNDGLAHRRVVALAFDAQGNGYAVTAGGGVYLHHAPGSVGRDDGAEVPAGLALHGNYPNPFNPTTTLHFDLPAAARVAVDVYDVLGRRVLALPERSFAAGPGQRLALDAATLPSGLYLYRLTARFAAGTARAAGRMMVVK